MTRSLFFSLSAVIVALISLHVLNSRAYAQESPVYQDFPTYHQDPRAYDPEFDESPGFSEYRSFGLDDDEIPETPPEPAPEAAPAPVLPRPDIDLSKKTILIGRIPYLSLKDMMQQVRPLLTHLRKATGAKEVRLVTAKDYAGVLEALSRDRIDFAWLGPAAYVQARARDRLMAIARARHHNAASYRGVFITRKDSGIHGLDDVKKRTIGFVDPESASGYLYPLYLLHRLNINPHKVCRSVRFFKRHDAVLKAVLDRKIDVGVCLDATLSALGDQSLLNQLLILGRTDEVPSDVICCRQDSPANLRNKVQAALLSIRPTKPVSGSLLSIPTFEAATDADYDEVQTVLDTVTPLIPPR